MIRGQLPIDIKAERDRSRRLVERERSKWETIKRASAILKKRFALPKVRDERKNPFCVEKRQTDKELLLAQNRNPRIFDETKKELKNSLTKKSNPLDTARSVYKASARADRRRIRTSEKDKKITFGHRPTSASRFMHLDPMLNSVHLTQSQYNVSTIQKRGEEEKRHDGSGGEQVGVSTIPLYITITIHHHHTTIIHHHHLSQNTRQE